MAFVRMILFLTIFDLSPWEYVLNLALKFDFESHVWVEVLIFDRYEHMSKWLWNMWDECGSSDSREFFIIWHVGKININ